MNVLHHVIFALSLLTIILDDVQAAVAIGTANQRSATQNYHQEDAMARIETQLNRLSRSVEQLISLPTMERFMAGISQLLSDSADSKTELLNLKAQILDMMIASHKMETEIVKLKLDNNHQGAEKDNRTVTNLDLQIIINRHSMELEMQKDQVQQLKQTMRTYEHKLDEMLTESHTTRLLVIQKTQALEEKLTMALGRGTSSMSAQEAVALKTLREAGDYRPIPEIISGVSETQSYDTCEEAIEKGYNTTGIYMIGKTRETSVAVYCALNGNEHYADLRPRIGIRERFFTDCLDAYKQGGTSSGIYRLLLSDNSTKDVWCEQEKYGGGWTVFQSRKDGSVDFFLDWSDYKTGFGHLLSEFWLGNDALHQLTEGRNQTLKLELTNTAGISGIADYTQFYIEDEAAAYRLHIGTYSGTAGDSLEYHNGHKFSTRDADHDSWSGSCSHDHKGAWWFNTCDYANLNGLYGDTNEDGVEWDGLSPKYLKKTRMMIRGNL